MESIWGKRNTEKATGLAEYKMQSLTNQASKQAFLVFRADKLKSL